MAAAEPRTAGRSSPPTECGQPKSPSGQMEESPEGSNYCWHICCFCCSAVALTNVELHFGF